MKRATTLLVMLVMAGWQLTAAQSTEYVFNPERTGELTDPFPVGSENGARGLSGPFDLDQDGQLEMLVGQHVGAGGVIHVIENTGTDTWELVYSTALLDSTTFDYNARFAQVGDLDSDGNLEIIYVGGNDYSQDDVAWRYVCLGTVLSARTTMERPRRPWGRSSTLTRISMQPPFSHRTFGFRMWTEMT